MEPKNKRTIVNSWVPPKNVDKEFEQTYKVALPNDVSLDDVLSEQVKTLALTTKALTESSTSGLSKDGTNSLSQCIKITLDLQANSHKLTDLDTKVIDSMLNQQLLALDRQTKYLYRTCSDSKFIVKDDITALTQLTRITMELKLKQLDMLENITDEDLENLAAE